MVINRGTDEDFQPLRVDRVRADVFEETFRQLRQLEIIDLESLKVRRYTRPLKGFMSPHTVLSLLTPCLTAEDNPTSSW
jgi:hypothetical protein